MSHGIQIWVEGKWITIQADSREHAIELRTKSRERVTTPCRRVVVLESGTTICAEAE